MTNVIKIRLIKVKVIKITAMKINRPIESRKNCEPKNQSYFLGHPSRPSQGLINVFDSNNINYLQLTFEVNFFIFDISGKLQMKSLS